MSTISDRDTCENWNNGTFQSPAGDDHSLSLASLESFLLLVSPDGSIAFVSPDVDTVLGLNPLDLMGNSIFDYIHLCDHTELSAILLTMSDRGTSQGPVVDPVFGQGPKFVWMKNTLTPKGKRVHLNQASYRVCPSHPLSINDREIGIFLLSD